MANADGGRLFSHLKRWCELRAGSLSCSCCCRAKLGWIVVASDTSLAIASAGTQAANKAQHDQGLNVWHQRTACAADREKCKSEIKRRIFKPSND